MGTVAVSFAFSPLGAVYLAMLFIPNLLWARLRRRDIDSASTKENPLLLALERVGQAGTTIAALFAPASDSPGTARLACLGVSLLAMVLYELSWLRYFQADRTPANLYRSLGPIPLPLALMPVLGFLLLALYEVHVVLLGAVILLGVGHVGIHRQHAANGPRTAEGALEPCRRKLFARVQIKRLSDGTKRRAAAD